MFVYEILWGLIFFTQKTRPFCAHSFFGKIFNSFGGKKLDIMVLDTESEQEMPKQQQETPLAASCWGDNFEIHHAVQRLFLKTKTYICIEEIHKYKSNTKLWLGAKSFSNVQDVVSDGSKAPSTSSIPLPDEGSAGSAKGDAPVTAGASSDKKARKDLVEVEADTVPTVEVDDHFSTWTLEDAIDFVGAWNSKSEMEKNRPQDMDDDKWSEVMLLFDIARQCDFNIHRIASFLDEMGRGEPYDFDPVAHDSQEVEGNTMLTESATLSDKNPNTEVSQPEVEECTVLSDSDCEIPPSQPVDSPLEEVTNSLADMALSQPAVDLEEDPVLEHILSNQEEDSQVDVLALTSQDFAAAEEEIRQSQGSKVDVATTIPWTAGEEVLEVDVEARSWPKKIQKVCYIYIVFPYARHVLCLYVYALIYACMKVFFLLWLLIATCPAQESQELKSSLVEADASSEFWRHFLREGGWIIA